jgi:hypothetical protein
MCEPYSPYIVAEYMATHNPPNGRVKQEKKPKLLPKFNYYLDESDPDVLVLRREDGTFVGAFSAVGATREGAPRSRRGRLPRLPPSAWVHLNPI